MVVKENENKDIHEIIGAIPFHVYEQDSELYAPKVSNFTALPLYNY